MSIGSQLISNTAAKNQQSREMEWNAEQAQINRDYQTSEREAAQQWNLEQWNRENEYNSPAAQLQRAAEAGMNPNMLYGSATGAQAQSGQVRTEGQSGSQANSVGSIAGDISRNLANSVNTMWQNLAAQQDVVGKEKDNELKGKELGIFDENWQLTKDDINSRIEAAKADAKDKEAAAKLKGQEFAFLENMNPIQLQTANMMYLRTKADVDHINQQIENLKKQYDLTDEQIKESQARQSNIDADTELKGVQADNVEADTDLKEAQTSLVESDKALRDVQKLIADKENVIKGLESSAAEQGISFSAPDFYNAYNYEKVTGNKFSDLTKPHRKEERKRVWRQTAANMTEHAVGSLVDAGTSWISNPFGASKGWQGAVGSTRTSGIPYDQYGTHSHVNPPTSGKRDFKFKQKSDYNY